VLNSPDAPPAASTGAAASTTLTSGMTSSASPAPASTSPASLPAAQFPNMTALADEFAFSDPDERFELLIDIFVDGLSRRAAKP
jgi:hypothetical protein